MATADHERYADDVGAYLLGALPELDAQSFRRHMLECSKCRDELEHLRPAAEALPRAVEPFVPPTSLKRSLMEVVKAEARERGGIEAVGRRRLFSRSRLAIVPTRAALAGAVAVLVAGAAIGFGVDRATRGAGGGARTIAARVDRSVLSRGSARLEVPSGGRSATLVVRNLPPPPAGKVYEVWIQRDGGVHPAGALFDVGRDGRGAAAIPGSVKGASAVLVTREPSRGSLRPTERPSIRIPV
jgi:anti-sigma factor RsiW